MASNLTRQAISESFIKLLNQYPLDKITVRQIVEDCGINRNTFYYHYRDVYALLQEIFDQEAAKVIGNQRNYESWQNGLIESARFALENKQAVYHVYSSAHRDYFVRYLDQVAGDLIHGFVVEQAQGLDVDPEDMHYIEIVYKYAVMGMIYEWVERHMKDDVEHIINRMGALFDGAVRRTLEKAAGLPRQG